MNSDFENQHFGICLQQGKKKKFFWFRTEAEQQETIQALQTIDGSAQSSRIEWAGHFDDLVYTNCDFSRNLHKKFFQLPFEVHEVEDGKVSEESRIDFYKFLNSGDV